MDQTAAGFLLTLAQQYGIGVLGIGALGWWAVRADNRAAAERATAAEAARVERATFMATVDRLAAQVGELAGAIRELRLTVGGR